MIIDEMEYKQIHKVWRRK